MRTETKFYRTTWWWAVPIAIQLSLYVLFFFFCWLIVRWCNHPLFLFIFSIGGSVGWRSFLSTHILICIKIPNSFFYFETFRLVYSDIDIIVIFRKLAINRH